MLPDDLLLFHLSDKHAFTRLTTGTGLPFQTSCSCPVQKDQVKVLFPKSSFFQLWSDPPNYLFKVQRNATVLVDISTWKSSPKMLLCIYKGTFAFQASTCTLGDHEKFLYHDHCLQQTLPSTLQPRRTEFFPVSSHLLPSTTSKPTIMLYIKQHFISSSDRFLQQGLDFIHVIDTRENWLQFLKSLSGQNEVIFPHFSLKMKTQLFS